MLSGRNVVVLKKSQPPRSANEGPVNREGRRSYRLTRPGNVRLYLEIKCCAIGALFGWGRFMYSYHTADRDRAVLCASGVFVEFSRDSNPWAFTPKVGSAFGVDWTSFAIRYSSTQNTVDARYHAGS